MSHLGCIGLPFFIKFGVGNLDKNYLSVKTAGYMPPFLNDVHPPHGPELAGQSLCIRSYSLVAEQAFAIILKGLDNPSLFPCTDLSSAESLGTMARVKSSPAVRTLTNLFTEACLEPQLGYNASSGRISFTIPLPVGFRVCARED